MATRKQIEDLQNAWTAERQLAESLVWESEHVMRKEKELSAARARLVATSLSHDEARRNVRKLEALIGVSK